MKKSKTFTPIHFLALLAGCLGVATAAPYPPDGRETSWVQPSGETLPLRVFGDEYYGRTETTAGYTVVYNSRDNTYYYAELSADGNELVPTGTLATEPAPAGAVKHLDLPKAKIREISVANNVKFNGERQKRWSQRVQAVRQVRAAGGVLKGAKAAGDEIQAAPVLGNKRGLTILVQFADDDQTPATDPINFPTNREKIVRFCNGVGYSEDGNSGSVRDYFYDQSLGKLTYTQTVTKIVTMPKARNYYNWADYPTNTKLRGDASRVLTADALDVLKADNFDFTSLTTDVNGLAVATSLFFAGPDSGQRLGGLWPQSWSLPSPVSVGTPAKPVFISNFQITNIEGSAPVIGTFCHENGHMLLDYPDIYSLFGEGVGEHCLMGSGNYLNNGKTPSPINGYFKEIVGWSTVTDFAIADFKTVRLPTTGNIAYRLTNPATTTEFFMVENRGTGDKWANFSDDKGIAIWHVDETVSGNVNIDPTGHYGIALEQADGRFDLEQNENRGDASDLFDIGSSKFNDNTFPDANWWDGSKSGIKVEVLTGVGAKTDVLFGAVPPNTILVDSPNGGEVIFPESNFNVKWRANLIGNVKIELFKAGVFVSTLSADEPNDGKFSWAVAPTLRTGRDYTLRISSLTNPVPTTDSSDANFTINDATFPTDGVMPFGWFKPGNANASWSVTKSDSYEGTHCLVSRPIGDGKVSAIAYRAKFKAGFVSFYMKVSSEHGFDFGRFLIDGQVQVFTASNGRAGLTGQSGWVFASFPVAAGSHTFQWTYEKDDSYAGLKDSAFVDGVSLPETNQEIAVANPAGTDVADGKSTTTFPSVAFGSSTQPLTFTIKNTGKGSLTGLKVTTIGANPADFTIRALGKTNLTPKQSTTFEVVFSPSGLGLRTASLRIGSNDEDESDFGITLEGTGLGLPEIGVSQPADTKIKDDGKTVKFGFAIVGVTGMTRTFTVKNTGSAVLSGLELDRTGPGRQDFRLGGLGVKTLAPGATTTFQVTFEPNARNERVAVIHLASNDKKSGPFQINVSGHGVPKNLGNKRAPATLAAAAGFPAGDSKVGLLSQTTSVEVIEGRKYLALTVIKPPGSAAAGTVEVSPDLLEWFSGKKHTTILVDDATTLKVRDNTPVSPGAKRYIRLK